MLKNLSATAAIALVVALGLGQSARAADAALPRHAGYHRVFHYEDRCGCLHWTYVYHRELRYTYGWGFDPRSYDMTEPHFYHGAVRRYVRYW